MKETSSVFSTVTELFSESPSPLQKPFDHQPRTRIVFGEGSLGRVGELTREIGATIVLLVTDPGIRRAGHPDRAAAALETAGLVVHIFDGVEENPTTRHVDAAVEFAQSRRVDCIVGLGGGSSMDTAKGANFLLTNGGRMADFWGQEKATKPMLPLVAVPTTAGTGSELQSFALIADDKTHQKMACGDKKAASRIAILDPELTVSQPRMVAAATGMDAVAHAVETWVTRPRNAISAMYGRQAWDLLDHAFETLATSPEDMDCRSAMLLGAALAGAAIENSMLGAAHSCANPLTAKFDITHGAAVGLMLPHVVRFNGESCAPLYGELLGWGGAGGDVADEAPEAMAARLTELLRLHGLPIRLADCGVPRESLGALAEDAGKQWTARFNPRALTPKDFEELFECAF